MDGEIHHDPTAGRFSLSSEEDEARLELLLLQRRDPAFAVAHQPLLEHLGRVVLAHAQVALLGGHPVALVEHPSQELVRTDVHRVQLQNSPHGLLGLRGQLLLLGPQPELVEVLGRLRHRRAFGVLLVGRLALLDRDHVRTRKLELTVARLDAHDLRVLDLDDALDAAAVVEHDHVAADRWSAEQEQREAGEQASGAERKHCEHVDPVRRDVD